MIRSTNYFLLNLQISHENAIITVAAKVALANKRRREEELTKEKSEESKEKTEKNDAERPEETDKETEATTEKSESAKSEKDIFPPPEISPKPSTSQKKTVTISLPKPPAKEVKKPGKSQKFEYGNYNRYYGYRNPGACLFPGTLEDPRLYHFRPEWFFGKDVLVITFKCWRFFIPKDTLQSFNEKQFVRF